MQEFEYLDSLPQKTLEQQLSDLIGKPGYQRCGTCSRFVPNAMKFPCCGLIKIIHFNKPELTIKSIDQLKEESLL